LHAVLTAPFLVASGLLVVSGMAKVVRPGSGSRSLRDAGLPGPPWAVRLLGTVEVVVGGAAAVRPSGPAAAAVALLYTGFAAFLVWLVRTGSARSCGCMGSREVPASWLHAALDLAAGATAAAVSIRPVAGLGPIVTASPARGAVVVAGLAAAGALAVAVVAEVPGAFAAYRRGGHRHEEETPGIRTLSLVRRPGR